MNLFLIFCFFFSSIKCEDWCSYIAPDGNYTELGITRHWRNPEENDFEYVMYNRVGNEWLFNITTDDNYSPQSIRIEMIEGSVRKGPDSDIINRFGIYGKSYQIGGEEMSTDIQIRRKVR